MLMLHHMNLGQMGLNCIAYPALEPGACPQNVLSNLIANLSCKGALPVYQTVFVLNW